MMRDDDREVELTRVFFREHGLFPEIPAAFGGGEDGEEDLLSRILVRRADRAHLRRSHRRRFGLIAAAVIVLAATGVTISLLRAAPAAAAGAPAMLAYSHGDIQSLGPASGASAMLVSASRAAAKEPTAPDDGSVQYIASYAWFSDIRIGNGGETDAVIYPTFTQWWLGPNGTVRVDERRGSPLGVDGRLTGTVSADGAEGDSSEVQPAGSIDAQLAARLATDNPETLRDALLKTQDGLPCAWGAWWRAQCLVSAVQTIYQQYVVEPRLASGLWHVLADEPALRSLGTTVDRLGRPADAIALPPESGQATQSVTVLLISAGTGAYLGSETVTLHDAGLDITKPTVTGFNEVATSRRVTTIGST